MKKNILEFVRRGLIACGFGPIVLAILYIIFTYSFRNFFVKLSEFTYTLLINFKDNLI